MSPAGAAVTPRTPFAARCHESKGGKNDLFHFSASKQADSPAQGKAQSHGQVVTEFPASYSRGDSRDSARSGEEGAALPSEILLSCGCTSSKPTVIAQTLPYQE